jgi:hypothetical protein
MGVSIAARAGYDPYGAARFLASMGRNAELKSNPGQVHIDPRARGCSEIPTIRVLLSSKRASKGFDGILPQFCNPRFRFHLTSADR